VLSEGKAKGQAIPITLSQFIIGRDAQCHLRPASAMISKRHCAILVKDGKVFVRDFDSTNGTSVNDDPVKGERQLKNDDLLKVGPLQFRVQLEATTPVNKPTPTPATKPAKAPEPVKASKPAKAPAPAKGGSDDDDVAAMLLSLQDDGDAGGVEKKDADGVPEGTTMMEILPPGLNGTDQQPAVKGEEKKPEEKKPEAKKAAADTSAAARAILEKYQRRPRS
jgi:predicted component of type VI protein secretion system